MFTRGAEEEKLHTSSLSLLATLSLSLPQPLGSSATSAQSHQRGTSGASLTPTETNAIGHGPSILPPHLPLSQTWPQPPFIRFTSAPLPTYMLKEKKKKSKSKRGGWSEA